MRSINKENQVTATLSADLSQLVNHSSSVVEYNLIKSLWSQYSAKTVKNIFTDDVRTRKITDTVKEYDLHL